MMLRDIVSVHQSDCSVSKTGLPISGHVVYKSCTSTPAYRLQWNGPIRVQKHVNNVTTLVKIKNKLLVTTIALNADAFVWLKRMKYK